MSKIQNLTMQKDVLLDQIQSLDFEFETGKLPEEVYQPQRAHLMTEAADILRQLDALKDVRAAATGVDDQIEAAIARASADDPIEAAVSQLAASKSVEPAKGKARFCTQCGKPIDAADKFCSSCGQKIGK